MMKLMNKKLTKKGFTLAELLIVVAIIAILVAVSIPIFTSQLDKAKTATDDANVRAAKAAAVTAYLTEELTAEEVYLYDAASGQVVTTGPVAAGYNQKEQNSIAKDTAVVQVTISENGANVQTAWVNKSTTLS